MIRGTAGVDLRRSSAGAAHLCETFRRPGAQDLRLPQAVTAHRGGGALGRGAGEEVGARRRPGTANWAGMNGAEASPAKGSGAAAAVAHDMRARSRRSMRGAGPEVPSTIQRVPGTLGGITRGRGRAVRTALLTATALGRASMMSGGRRGERMNGAGVGVRAGNCGGAGALVIGILIAASLGTAGVGARASAESVAGGIGPETAAAGTGGRQVGNRGHQIGNPEAVPLSRAPPTSARLAGHRLAAVT
jgi:hypothetical protein